MCWQLEGIDRQRVLRCLDILQKTRLDEEETDRRVTWTIRNVRKWSDPRHSKTSILIPLQHSTIPPPTCLSLNSQQTPPTLSPNPLNAPNHTSTHNSLLPILRSIRSARGIISPTQSRGGSTDPITIKNPPIKRQSLNNSAKTSRLSWVILQAIGSLDLVGTHASISIVRAADCVSGVSCVLN